MLSLFLCSMDGNCDFISGFKKLRSFRYLLLLFPFSPLPFLLAVADGIGMGSIAQHDHIDSYGRKESEMVQRIWC